MKPLSGFSIKESSMSLDMLDSLFERAFYEKTNKTEKVCTDLWDNLIVSDGSVSIVKAAALGKSYYK